MVNKIVARYKSKVGTDSPRATARVSTISQTAITVRKTEGYFIFRLSIRLTCTPPASPCPPPENHKYQLRKLSSVYFRQTPPAARSGSRGTKSSPRHYNRRPAERNKSVLKGKYLSIKIYPLTIYLSMIQSARE